MDRVIMKNTIKFLCFLLLIPFVSGCNKKEEFSVDPNDPSSVENSSKTPPVLMNSDGSPVISGEAGEPPKK